MIIDKITNAHLYGALRMRIKRAFDYIQKTDILTLDTGRYQIEGENIYLTLQEYVTKPIDQGRWEAHRRYIDLQYMVRGKERIGYAHISQLTPGDYDVDKDVSYYSGDGDFLTLQPGAFMLILPEDGHMPGMAVDMPALVKKAVVKIAVSG